MSGGGLLDPGPDGEPADCGSCGRAFTVPRQKAGSYVNCPNCGKAVEVGGGRDILWWGVVGLATLGLLLVAGFFWVRLGPPTGLAVFFGGLGGGWLVSRAL